MDDSEPRSGELTTANYGWVKPTVGASVDAWGGYINTDLDGIDTTVKGVSTVANAAYPASNPNGYQTAAQVTATLGSYLPLAGGVMTGALTMTPNSSIDGAAGTARSLTAKTSGSPRWELDLGNTTAESGTSTGSDFTLTRYNNSGAFIDSPMSISRSNGQMQLTQNLTVGDGFSADAFTVLNPKAGNYGGVIAYSGWSQRWTVSLIGNPTETGSGNTGSDLGIQAYNDAGSLLSTPLTIKRSSGLVTVAADPTAPLGVATKQYVDARTAAVSAIAPSSPVAGSLWFDTNGGQMYVWYNDGNSSQWVPVVNQGSGLAGPAGPSGQAALIAPPVASAWTQRNFGGATTLTNVANGVSLFDSSAVAATNNWRGATLASPTTPYTVDLNVTACGLVLSGGSLIAGAGWTDGTKLQTIFSQIAYNGAPFLYVAHYSTFATLVAADYNPGGLFDPQNLWFRLKDDGVNVVWSISSDGVTFIPIFTTTKASGYLGSSGYSNIGFFFNSAELGSGGSGFVTLRSWWVH